MSEPRHLDVYIEPPSSRAYPRCHLLIVLEPTAGGAYLSLSSTWCGRRPHLLLSSQRPPSLAWLVPRAHNTPPRTSQVQQVSQKRRRMGSLERTNVAQTARTPRSARTSTSTTSPTGVFGVRPTVEPSLKMSESKVCYDMSRRKGSFKSSQSRELIISLLSPISTVLVSQWLTAPNLGAGRA